MSTKKSETMKFLEKLTGGPLTMGKIISSARKCEEQTQSEFAKRLRITVSHLSDIENGRKVVSPERAAKFARALGLSEAHFVRVALQDELNRQGLEKYQVKLSVTEVWKVLEEKSAYSKSEKSLLNAEKMEVASPEYVAVKSSLKTSSHNSNKVALYVRQSAFKMKAAGVKG